MSVVVPINRERKYWSEDIQLPSLSSIISKLSVAESPLQMSDILKPLLCVTADSDPSDEQVWVTIAHLCAAFSPDQKTLKHINVERNIGIIMFRIMTECIHSSSKQKQFAAEFFALVSNTLVFIAPEAYRKAWMEVRTFLCHNTHVDDTENANLIFVGKLSR